MFYAIHIKQLGKVIERDLIFHILILVLKSFICLMMVYVRI